MEVLIQDLRYGLRMLLKSPGFACMVMLALGSGANTAMSSIGRVDGINEATEASLKCQSRS